MYSISELKDIRTLGRFIYGGNPPETRCDMGMSLEEIHERYRKQASSVKEFSGPAIGIMELDTDTGGIRIIKYKKPISKSKIRK